VWRAIIVLRSISVSSLKFLFCGVDVENALVSRFFPFSTCRLLITVSVQIIDRIVFIGEQGCTFNINLKRVFIGDD